MGVVHIVLFHFKPDRDQVLVQSVCDKMLGLKEACKKPGTNEPYIKSSVGGLQNSIEGRADGVTHAFVVEFHNVADRDYYVKEDPAHRAFVQSVADDVVHVQVVDFVPGTW